MLVVISGSAGVGKNTVITELLKRNPHIKLFKTCTTRQPRNTDADMQNPYIYLSKEEFEEKINAGKFFEFEEIHKNLYGILNETLEQTQKTNNVFIKDVGVQGQARLSKALGKEKLLSIFLTLPTEELRTRLTLRGDHDTETRLSRIDYELFHKTNYDYVIPNYSSVQTAKRIEKMILKTAKAKKEPAHRM